MAPFLSSYICGFILPTQTYITSIITTSSHLTNHKSDKVTETYSINLSHGKFIVTFLYVKILTYMQMYYTLIYTYIITREILIYDFKC